LTKRDGFAGCRVATPHLKSNKHAKADLPFSIRMLTNLYPPTYPKGKPERENSVCHHSLAPQKLLLLQWLSLFFQVSSKSGSKKSESRLTQGDGRVYLTAVAVMNGDQVESDLSKTKTNPLSWIFLLLVMAMSFNRNGKSRERMSARMCNCQARNDVDSCG
jgi:hypothetical protein